MTEAVMTGVELGKIAANTLIARGAGFISILKNADTDQFQKGLRRYESQRT